MPPPSNEPPLRRPLRIAMLGMRGVPANYGGLEKVAEEVGARLVERGHQVTAYCRTHNATRRDPVYRGIRRVEMPSLHRKHFDTPTHTATAAVHALAHRSDIVHVFGVGNAPWLPMLRLAGGATVISVDGMDWRRRKWGWLARNLLERSSLLAMRASSACITDSREVARWYVARYGRAPHYISHGVDMREIAGRGALRTYGLDERGYVLFVGRVTPEKGVHHLIEAFRDLDTEKVLVIVGDGSGDPEYWKSLHMRAAGRRNVKLLGPVYGEPVRELFAHAYVYVQPSEVEGTALSVVEAMGYGNCVLVSDIAENVETVGEAGLTFDINRPVESLRARLVELIASPDVVACQRARSLAHAREHFSWERVTDAHEELYYNAASGPR